MELGENERYREQAGWLSHHGHYINNHVSDA